MVNKEPNWEALEEQHERSFAWHPMSPYYKGPNEEPDLTNDEKERMACPKFPCSTCKNKIVCSDI